MPLAPADGAWVVHIQVASGRSAAVESSASESRAAAGVRGFKFTVVPGHVAKVTRSDVVCPSCSMPYGIHTVLAGAHE